MQKSLKIVSIVLFSLIFCLALFFAFNATSEIKVLAEGEVQVATNETQLRTAIENAVPNTLTKIQLSGTIELTDEVLVQGASEQVKKIKFVAVDNTTIIRKSTNTEFIMFNIGGFAEVYFETIGGKELIIDGNRENENPLTEENYYHFFKLTKSSLNLKGNIKLINNLTLSGGINFNSGSSLICENISFINNIAGSYGAAVRAQGGEATFINCKFKNNYGGAYGGAISSEGADMTFVNCLFEGNELKGYTNRPDNTVHGGAIVFYNGTSTITDCEFKNNKAFSAYASDANPIKGYGGAICLVGGSLTINGATQEGGGVFLDGGDRTINGVTISGNSADFGGAIAVLSGNLTVNDFEVSGNSATQEGGGLYLKSGTVKINGGTIKNNTTSAGGAQDVAWLISDSGNDYLSNNIFSAKVENENNNYVIYSESDFPVGENFELGKNNYVNLLADKTIYVAKKLNTENAIIISALSSTGSIVGKPVVYFADDSAITENVFEMNIPEYNLVLGKDTQTGTNYLFVSTQYRVQFYQYYDDVQGNVNKLAEEQRVEYNNPAIKPAPGTRDGMIFIGWEAREWGDNSKPTSMTPDHITSNVVFVGIWGVEVKVEFEADGTIIGEHPMVSNTAIDANTLNSYIIPTKTGYTETAPYWAIEVDGEKIKYENQKITGDTTLYAVYVPNVMNITLKDENGIELLTLNVNYNATLTADALNSFPALEYDRTGYNQTAPYWAYAGTTTQFDQTEKITENIVLVATYFKNKYTITFEVYYKSSTSEFSDKSLPTQTVEYLDTVDTLPTPNEFEGYNPANVVWDYDGAPIESNLIITGEVYINKYTVSFIANGEILASYEKEHFETLTKKEIPAIPVKEGYTQRAPQWDKDTSSEIESNINFEAEYYLNVYTITFVLPDGTKIDRTVKHGHTVDNSNIIDIGFGEIVKYDKPLENITADGEIRVTTINLFMWIMIGVGVIVLAVSAFMIYKLVKRRRVIAEARKRHRHIGPYVTGDDEFN